MITLILCIVIAVILLQWLFTDIFLNKESKRYFIISIFFIIIVSIAEIGCSIFDNTVPENRIISIICNMIGFGLSPFIFLLESLFYAKKHTWLIYIPSFINLIFIFLSPTYGFIFYVTPDCIYKRGPLFFIYIIVVAFSFIVSMIRKLKSLIYFPPYFRNRIFYNSIIMIAAILVQVFFPKYHTTWLIVCIYFIFHYALICEINSMVDGLTGLLNKSVFNRQIENLNISKKTDYYILMIDVNDFKFVNDTNGHLYGDKCLLEISNILKDHFETKAQIYRFGGDEFCVFIKCKSKEDIEQHISEIYKKIEQKKTQNDKFPNIAMGYEKFKPDINKNITVDIADEHMYKNKQKMKNHENHN